MWLQKFIYLILYLFAEADSSAGSSGGVNAVRLVLAHTHTYTLYGIVLAREYDMHTSVHESCMHNFIHTLYCAYLSVLLVQCTLYTTYSMHTRVLRARVCLFVNLPPGSHLLCQQTMTPQTFCPGGCIMFCLSARVAGCPRRLPNKKLTKSVCILLASTLEYGMHTTTLVVVIPKRTIHTMHTN